eukprot:CAMPEP_0172595680 /NCGR_PEP_ID=MMETSP1068-20121228/15298_1 /TAXON_ID=35684 /ORGANISM="Pseudopedinella elastica, Strain CCMP716" /LENGTH=499 /DNA_ID=CAMNT_0013394319 /DNA_START=207 /DNA_END=1706 /DNA_ORIENTATION=-
MRLHTAAGAAAGARGGLALARRLEKKNAAVVSGEARRPALGAGPFCGWRVAVLWPEAAAGDLRLLEALKGALEEAGVAVLGALKDLEDLEGKGFEGSGFDRVVVRSAEAPVTEREEAAVLEWVTSGLPCHAIRDRPADFSPGVLPFRVRGVVRGLSSLRPPDCAALLVHDAGLQGGGIAAMTAGPGQLNEAAEVGTLGQVAAAAAAAGGGAVPAGVDPSAVSWAPFSSERRGPTDSVGLELTAGGAFRAAGQALSQQNLSGSEEAPKSRPASGSLLSGRGLPRGALPAVQVLGLGGSGHGSGQDRSSDEAVEIDYPPAFGVLDGEALSWEAPRPEGPPLRRVRVFLRAQVTAARSEASGRGLRLCAAAFEVSPLRPAAAPFSEALSRRPLRGEVCAPASAAGGAVELAVELASCAPSRLVAALRKGSTHPTEEEEPAIAEASLEFGFLEGPWCEEPDLEGVLAEYNRPLSPYGNGLQGTGCEVPGKASGGAHQLCRPGA